MEPFRIPPLGRRLAAAEDEEAPRRRHDHARGGPGLTVPGARDEVHGHVPDRFFEELMEEPGNIHFTTATGPDSLRYDAMDPAFWIDCLDLLERTLCPD